MYVLQKDNPEDYTAALRRTNASGHSVLHHAASMSTQLRVISRLLAWGADPNGLAEPIKRARIGEDRGTTPLHLAAKRSDGSREGIVRVLLAGGANTFQQDHGPEQSGGRQALHYAAAYDADVRVIELLQQVQLSQQSIIGAVGDRARIAVRRDPKMIKDDKQRTALHVATSRDANLDVLWSLLQFGFSPDDEDHKGVTPLMRSAEKSSDPDTFYLLLDSAKNPCQASADGYTVEAYLKNNEHLSNFDSSGAEASPLENLKERCP